MHDTMNDAFNWVIMEHEHTPKAPPTEAAPETTNTSSAEQSASSESEAAADDHRTFAVLGYIIPPLFFLPLLNDETKHVPYVRFHANQQLILLILIVAVYVLHSTLMVMLMSLGLLVAKLLNLVIIVLAIIGAVHAYKGEMKALPVIGQFKILN